MRCLKIPSCLHEPSPGRGSKEIDLHFDQSSEDIQGGVLLQPIEQYFKYRNPLFGRLSTVLRLRTVPSTSTMSHCFEYRQQNQLSLRRPGISFCKLLLPAVSDESDLSLCDKHSDSTNVPTAIKKLQPFHTAKNWICKSATASSASNRLWPVDYLVQLMAVVAMARLS